MEDSPIDMLNQLADQRSLSAKFPQEYKDWLGKFADDPEIFSKDAFENFLRKYVDPSSGNDPAQIARKIDELLTRDGISDSVKNQLVQARENLLRENPNIFSPRAATLEAESAATEKAKKSAAMLSSTLGVTDESGNEKLSPQEVAQATQERAIEDAASGKKEPLPGAFEETPTSLATTREVNEKIYQELQGGIENYKKSLVQNVPDEYKDYFLNYVEKNPGQPVTAPQRPDNYVNNLLKSAGIDSPELKAAIENYDRATELGLIMASQNFRESLKPQTKGEWVGSVAALGVMPESLLLGLALAPVVEKVVKETVDYTANQNPKSHKENGSPYIWDINNEKEKLSGLRKQLLEHDLGVTSLSEEQITGIKEKIGESYKKIAKAEIEIRKEPFIYAGPEDLPGKDPGPDISKINEPAEEAARLTTEQISPETAAKIIKETSGEREKIADRSYKGPEDFWGLAENKFTKPVTDTLFGFEPFYKEEKNDYGLPKIPDNPYKPSTGASTQSAEEWQNFVAENYNEGENGSQEKPFSCKECEKGDNLLTSMFEFDKNTNELKLKENWRDLAKIKGRGAYFHFPSKQKILEKMVQQKLITQDQMNAAMNKSATDVTLPNGTKVINKDTNKAKTFNENPDKNKNETNKVNFSDQDIMPE